MMIRRVLTNVWTWCIVVPFVIVAAVVVPVAVFDDDSKCIKGHWIYVPQTHLVGKSVIVTTSPVWICDKSVKVR